MEGISRASEADVLRALRGMEDRGIRVIREPSPLEHVEVDPAGFATPFEKKQPYLLSEVQETADACAEFISNPIVADSFPTHADRVAWNNEFAARLGVAVTKFYMRNNLRHNNLAGVAQWIKTLDSAFRIYQVQSQKVDAIQELVKKLPNLESYSDISNAERLEIVLKMDAICREFLEIVRKS